MGDERQLLERLAPGAVRRRMLAAMSVHVFTASGAVLAMLALAAASQAQWRWMFALLGAALIVDGVDGALARRLNVRERLPRWSGEVLDLVIDYTTYVVVPAFAIVVSGFAPYGIGVALAALIAFTGALYFADSRMKTPDHHFRGFPALWNLAAFYLFVLRPGPAATVLLIVALAVLTFVPIRIIHPVRVVRNRPLNLVLTAIWAGLALWALVLDFAQPLSVTIALCAIGLYFLLAGSLVRPRMEQVDD